MKVEQINSYIKDILADKKKTRDAAILLAVILGLVFYILFLIKPVMSGVFTAIPEVAALKTKIEKTTGKLTPEGEEALNRRLASLTKDLGNFKTRLPVEKEIPALLENLSSMARDSNVIIVGITPGPAETSLKTASAPSGVYQEIPIIINAKSGYHELGKFINNMENLNRFVEVSEIEIQANKRNPYKHDIVLRISTYLLR